MNTDDWLAAFQDAVVCIEIGDGFQIFGTVSDIGHAHLTCRDADLHDTVSANCDRDHYAAEAAHAGVSINRVAVTIPRQRIIAISRLSDLC